MKVGLIGFVVAFAALVALFWYAGVDYGQRSPMAAFSVGFSLMASIIIGIAVDDIKRGDS